MRRNTQTALALILFLLLSCDKWDLEQQEFIQLEVTSVEALSIDSVRIVARIKDLMAENLQEHGFLWTTQEGEPGIFFNEGKRPLGAKTVEEGPAFSTVLKLKPATRYFLRAYATVDGAEYTYSEVEEFFTGNGGVATLGYDYESNFSLDLSGRLSGTDKGLLALKHGFCWSATNQQPTLADNFIDLGARRTDEPFTFTLDGLENEQALYCRAYVLFQNEPKVDTLYGEVLLFDGDLNFWTRKADLPGVLRVAGWGAGFSIGNKGYYGTGATPGHTAQEDFWEYDPQSDSWTQKADFGGGKRERAVGFSIGQKGYLGLGYNNNDSQNKQKADFWEYDPQSNTWIRKADYGGGARYYGGIGFSIGSKGYVGVGTMLLGLGVNNIIDFWEYDPQQDSWNQKADFPGTRRSQHVGFAIGQKGYVGTGQGLSTLADFWEYDPQVDAWEQKKDFPGGPRRLAFAFSAGLKGYIGGGLGTVVKKDLWEYDPQQDSWVQRADFEGGLRELAFGFSIAQKGYVGGGVDKKDFWEYDP